MYVVQAKNLYKQTIRTTFTNIRITKQIDNVREVFRQALRQWYVARCEWRRLQEIDVQMQAIES